MFTLQAEVATALNDTVEGTSRSSPDFRGGIIQSVTPIATNGTAIPRGRIFARAILVEGDEPLAVLWQGYLVARSGKTWAGPSSTPGIPMAEHHRIKIEATQTGQGAATNVAFHVRVAPFVNGREHPSLASGYIFQEAPGSGEGEVRRIAIAAPAAGANPASTTVGAKVRLRLRTAIVTLTADATAANRVPGVRGDDGAVDLWEAFASTATTASLVATYSWGIGFTDGGTIASGIRSPLPLHAYTAGMRIEWATAALQAGDQYGAASLMVEEWAFP